MLSSRVPMKGGDRCPALNGTEDVGAPEDGSTCYNYRETEVQHEIA